MISSGKPFPGALLLLLGLSVLQARAALYPFGPQIDRVLSTGDDVSQEVQLQVPIRFYGQIYQNIYVNTNGLLSFMTELPKFFNEPFPLEYPVVAPLYANVDTRGSGGVYFRESREPEVLSQVAGKVAQLYPGLPPFRPLAAFIATWKDVGYFNAKADKVNTFQAVVSSDGSETFVELLYPPNGVGWIRAESQGTNSLLDASAQAGISSPGFKLAVLKGSGTDRVHNLPKWTNTLTPGEYMFRVGNIEDLGKPEPPQRTVEDQGDEEPRSCAEDGSLLCHKHSECIDEPEGGFCCKCQKGYIGDGRNCLDGASSHRMLGKVNISLNGYEQRELNMQAYIVTGDGRTYTAISGVPPVIGYDMMLLTNLGSFVGFLFAKPLGGAPNGYQLTGGVVNHTAEISFDTHHHVTIHQRYSGLNLFEQVKMEAEVRGTLPAVPPGTRLNVLDFQEHFTRVAPGSFRSLSKHTIEVENTNSRHEITVDQTINFKEYCPSAYRDLKSLRLKSSRHFLNFEERDSILRLASTNKISQNSEGQDPCVEGHVTCVANSTCLVEGDSFRCVCDSGFQALSSGEASEFGCVDINECEEGSARCHPSALCVNEVGSYSCQCLPGYRGDGRYCESLAPASIPNGICRGQDTQRSCICNPGYIQVPDASELGFRCEDIDECAESNPCDPKSNCYNSPGGFRCECLPGYDGDGFRCIERGQVNDCENKDCPDGYDCQETEDGPVCICPEGYVGTPPYCQPEYDYRPPPPQPPAPIHQVCHDNNDCRENFICDYNSTWGQYMCVCRPGYTQDQYSCLPPANEASFVRTCMDGECWCPPGYFDNGELCVRTTTTPSPDPIQQLSCREENNCNENAKCIYVHATRAYECKCNPGFEGDGYTCTEFEISCSNQSQICDINAECRYDSTTGRHICICNEGYQGDGTTCYPSEPSEDQCPQCHENARCYGDSCVCDEGFVGDGIHCERTIPGCDSLGNCHAEADCLYDIAEQGYRCKCRQGFEGNGYFCEEIITCHDDPSMCSPYATCQNSYTSYECRCNEGYFGNGTYCKEVNRQEEEFLLLNKGRATIKLPFKPSARNSGRLIQISGEQQVIGIAADCIEGRVYWSDIMNQRIKSSKYDGTDTQDFLVSGVKSPEGLAIDWINRRLYWTDSALHVISSASLDESDRQIKNIITNGLVNPRGIAVHPYRRKLFWSDWNRKDPIIESSDLEGRNREVLVQKPSVTLPNSIAIDWDTNEICWADAGLKKIECYDFERRVSRTVVQQCLYPFGLAITPEAYYWTDWSTGKVETSVKGSGVPSKSIPLPIGGDDKLYGLVAVTSQCPRY